MNTQDLRLQSELIVRAIRLGERAWASEIVVSARVLTTQNTPAFTDEPTIAKRASETRIGRPSPTRSAAVGTGQATIDERAAARVSVLAAEHTE